MELFGYLIALAMFSLASYEAGVRMGERRQTRRGRHDRDFRRCIEEGNACFRGSRP